jgi:hypothetical protein
LNRRLADPLRRTVRGARAWVTPPGRLPEFVIIGTQRGGTTSLYRYLSGHPSVRPATGKELQFLSLHHRRGPRWYAGHFPVRPAGVQSFEASPYYLYDPDVPARAAELLPSAKFVAVLRDPVERAYSHYLHSVAYGVEPLSFADALAAEPARLAAGDHTARRQYSYADRGRYAEQLSRWFAHVPRERMLILRTEELSSSHDRVLDFLGLEPHSPPQARHTRRVDGPGPTQLTDDLRASLTAGFAPHNAALADLLTWKTVPWRL